MRIDAVRIDSLSYYSEIYKLPFLPCEQPGEKTMFCCESLVHEFWALLCPATRALAFGRTAQSSSDPMVSEGSRDLLSTK